MSQINPDMIVLAREARGLTQAVVAHGQEVQIADQGPVLLRFEVGTQNHHGFAIAPGSEAVGEAGRGRKPG